MSILAIAEYSDHLKYDKYTATVDEIMQKVDAIDMLTKEQKNRLREILLRYRHVFSS